MHQHLWPEPLVDTLAERRSPPLLRNHTLVLGEGEYEIDPTDYGADACLANLDRAGIDVAVVSCPPTLGIDQLERMQARGFDIGRSLHTAIYLEASSYGRRALELCLATFGARQIVYGSDSPVIDCRLTLDHVRTFGDAAVDALCRDNPMTLLS